MREFATFGMKDGSTTNIKCSVQRQVLAADTCRRKYEGLLTQMNNQHIKRYVCWPINNHLQHTFTNFSQILENREDRRTKLF